MTKEEKELLTFKEEPNSENKYSQSANTLFKFVTKIDYLIEIIKNMSIAPRYVEEDIQYLSIFDGNNQINNVAFPMICFCDINIHRLSQHTEGIKEEEGGYGQYGIGLDKEWCEQNGIQSVFYLNKNSLQRKSISYSINQGINNIESMTKDVEKLYDGFFEILKVVKPLRGEMWKDDKKINKNFHDEQEWRYLPIVNEESDLNEFSFLNSITHKQEINNLGFFSELLKRDSRLLLDIEIPIIKYIFVNSIEDRDQILEVIRDKYKEDIESLQLLSSKILVYKELRGDW